MVGEQGWNSIWGWGGGRVGYRGVVAVWFGGVSRRDLWCCVGGGWGGGRCSLWGRRPSRRRTPGVEWDDQGGGGADIFILVASGGGVSAGPDKAVRPLEVPVWRVGGVEPGRSHWLVRRGTGAFEGSKLAGVRTACATAAWLGRAGVGGKMVRVTV